MRGNQILVPPDWNLCRIPHCALNLKVDRHREHYERKAYANSESYKALKKESFIGGQELRLNESLVD